jgi:hypothetical protein
MLPALRKFSTNTGRRYRRSPGATGMQLMEAVHRGPRAIHLDASSPPPPALEEVRADRDLNWIRPLTESEAALPWAHALDINAMYLSSCGSLELGFGQAEHLEGRIAFDKKLPGYWLATINGEWDPLMPPPLEVGEEPSWWTSPSVELAEELGLKVEIAEAWVFPEHRRWLYPWYCRLRDARASLLADPSPEAEAALQALKAVYREALGWLEGGWLRPGDERFRPDWRDAVIARARANFYRALRKAEAAGVRPFAVNVDAVYFASPDPDPEQAAAGLGLTVAPNPGKFKVLGSAPVAAVRDLLEAQLRDRGILSVDRLRELVKGRSAP